MVLGCQDAIQQWQAEAIWQANHPSSETHEMRMPMQS